MSKGFVGSADVGSLRQMAALSRPNRTPCGVIHGHKLNLFLNLRIWFVR